MLAPLEGTDKPADRQTPTRLVVCMAPLSSPDELNSFFPRRLMSSYLYTRYARALSVVNQRVILVGSQLSISRNRPWKLRRITTRPPEARGCHDKTSNYSYKHFLFLISQAL